MSGMGLISAIADIGTKVSDSVNNKEGEFNLSTDWGLDPLGTTYNFLTAGEDRARAGMDEEERKKRERAQWNIQRVLLQQRASDAADKINWRNSFRRAISNGSM